MVSRRSVFRRRLALTLGITALLSPALLGGTASAEGTPVASVLQSARKAIARQTGVHVMFAAHEGSPSSTEKITADVGITDGEETVHEGTAELAIRVTPACGYVSGPTPG